MKSVMTLGLSLLAACVTSVAAADAVPEIPATPAPVLNVISAQPFTLDKSFNHLWREEAPAMSSGYILVLKVDPDLVFPRQIAEPVLYVGNQTAERVNHGYESGHVVAIVPCVLDDPKHPDYLDLDKALMWFGTPALPEQVDAKTIKREHALAVRAGIKPLKVKVSTDSALRAANKEAVYEQAVELIREHSPQEEALLEGLTPSDD